MRLLLAALLALSPGTVPSLDLPPEGIVITAEASTTAARGTQVQVTETLPPPNTMPTFSSNCDEMSWYRQRVGLPARFDQIGWRESNCRNEDGVHTSCCYGWWQLHISLFMRDARMVPKLIACGVDSYQDVNSDTPEDKLRQACAAKALFDTVGYSAWAL